MRGFFEGKSDVVNTKLHFFSTKPQLFLYIVVDSVFYNSVVFLVLLDVLISPSDVVKLVIIFNSENS